MDDDAQHVDDELAAPEPDLDDELAEPEAETGDDVVEPEPEPEPDDVDDGRSIEAVKRELDREATRHEKALAKALGLPVEALHSCPTCEGTGYTPEPIEAEPELVQDPFTQTCERCKGNGRTLSGATSLALREIPCNGCGGSGYVQLPEQPAAGAPAGNGPAAQAPTYAPPLPAADVPPEVLALRQQGYTVVEPIVVPEAAQT